MAILMVFQVFPEMGVRPIILAKKVSKVDVEEIFVLRILAAIISTFLMYYIVRNLSILELVGVLIYLISRPYMDYLHFSDANENSGATIQYTLFVVALTSIIKIYFAIEWQNVFWVYLGFEGILTISWSYYNRFLYRRTLYLALKKVLNYLPLIFSSFVVALSNRLDVLYVQIVEKSYVATFNYSIMLSTGLYFVLSAFFLVDINKVTLETIHKIETKVLCVIILLVFIPILIHIIHTSYFTKEFQGNKIFTMLYSTNILLQLPLMRLSHVLIKELGTKFVLFKDVSFLFFSIATNIIFYALFGLYGVILGTLMSSVMNLLVWNYVLKYSK